MLAEQVPLTRSCYQANIPEYNCACYEEVPVNNPNEDLTIVSAANFLIDTINDDLAGKYIEPHVKLEPGHHCAKLSLVGVHSASKISASNSVINDVQTNSIFGWLEPGRRIGASEIGKSNRDFLVVAEALPKGAMFEGRVSTGSNGKTKFNLIGPIQRVNRYGNQSWCISGSAAAKKFCICE